MNYIRLLTLLFIVLISPISATSLREKMMTAQAGDYLVTKQGGLYSVLLIRTLSPFVIEEISTSTEQTNWRKWVEEGAPKHSSWVLYEINVQEGKLVRAYSYVYRSWLAPGNSDLFLTQLFTLPLSKVPVENRRRIGPKPLGDERDVRALWNPKLIIEGKKWEKTSFEVWQGKWPEDGTYLAGCHIVLYFSQQKDAVSLPYWIEVQSPHYTFKLQAIDSGRNLVMNKFSPKDDFP